MTVRRSHGGQTTLAAVLIVAAAVLTLATGGRFGGGRFSPAPDVPRLDGATVVELPPIGRVADIAAIGGRLYVLDGIAAGVLVVDADDGRVAIRFGRKGCGPGELLHPRSLAVSPAGDSVAVADGATVHFFTADGRFRGTLRPDYRCAVSDAQVVWPATGLHVAASCVGARADTLFAVLWRIEPGGRAREVAREGRYTLDGRWGTPFGPRFFATEMGAGISFGTAATGCVRLIDTSGALLRCFADEPAYRSPPPPGFTGGGGRVAALVKWPDPLPLYVDRMAARPTTWLARPFRHDSLIVRSIDRDGEFSDRIAGPLDTFVRCRAGACYWAESDAPSRTRVHIARLTEP